jgi:hypothetical protein
MEHTAMQSRQNMRSHSKFTMKRECSAKHKQFMEWIRISRAQNPTNREREPSESTLPLNQVHEH